VSERTRTVGRAFISSVEVGVAAGLFWNLVSVSVRHTPVPLYDYTGPVFSPWFLKFWSTSVGLLLLLTTACALLGFAVAVAAGMPGGARWFSLGLALFPIAFFGSLPADNSVALCTIVFALGKGALAAAVGGLVSWMLFPVEVKPYMRAAWFPLALALCIGLPPCLYFAGLYDWKTTSQLVWFSVSAAAFLLFLWIVLRLCHPDRMERLVSALLFSLFACVVSSVWLDNVYVAIASLPFFAVGCLLFSFWKGLQRWLCVLIIGFVVSVWAVGGLWSFARASGESDRASRRPNFVVVVLDALRYDAIGPHGGIVPTPNIDELAANGIVFEQARSSASWTIPSVASLFTGLWSVAVGTDSANHHLYRGFTTLAERLHNAGYFTAAIFDSLALLDTRGFDQGFDVVLGVREEMEFPSYARLDTFRAPTFAFWYPSRVSPYPDHTLGLVSFARQMLRGMKEPFILWIHFLDPHAPYIPPRRFTDHISELDRELEWDGKKTRVYRLLEQPASKCLRSDSCADLVQRAHELYLGEVRLVDFAVGELTSELKRHGLWDDTVFVLTSDHGEEFGEHKGFSHGRTLYEELLRVPLIVRIPGRSPENIYTPVRTMDINPTLLELAGVSYDPEALHARSLLPVIDGEEQEARPVLLETDLSGGLKHGLLYGDYKLICYSKPERCELFDLMRDPAELNPIVSGAEFEDMRARLQAAVSSCGGLYEKVAGHKRKYGQKPSPDAVERLKAMGYIR